MAEAQAAEEEVLTDRALSESMDESIRTTLRDIQGRTTDAPAEEPPAPEPAADAPAPAADKPRAADGKFVAAKDAPKDSAAAAKADTHAKAATPAAPEPAAADTVQPDETLRFGKVEVDLARPPSSWKPAAKAAWAALPPDVQREIYRRETDFSNTVLNGPLKETADFGREVKAVVEPYRMLIEAEGGTPAKAIAETMRTAALFRVGTQKQKQDALYELDKRFNCGFEAEFTRLLQQEVARTTGGQPQAGQLAAQPALIGTQAAPATDPRVDALIEGMQRQERERAARDEKASIDSVQSFWNAKDDKGQPKYPFIDNVLDDMTDRVSQLRRHNPALDHASALQQAYEAAVWANPETRQVLIAAQAAPAVADAESQRKVAQARVAGAGNLPKRGALPASGPVASLDDTIRETGRKLGMF